MRERKEIEILEANLCPDNIRVLVKISLEYSVSQILGYLKGKSSLIIFDRFANLKYKYGNRNIWRRGYYIDTVGRNQKKISEYMRDQLKEYCQTDHLSIRELLDPFTGDPIQAGKRTIAHPP